MNSRIYTNCNKGHANFSGKVIPLFEHMYTAERLELVKKVIAKRAKEEEIKRKEDVEVERKSKRMQRKGKEKVAGDKGEKRKRDSRAGGERPAGGFMQSAMGAGKREEEKKR
ncbi:hypothetical protein L1987_07632 [Smallanthus sonchifolius]|uniref:Uncharacterized protein n=1 Tax=Smallanthus sonchifolius TaxID=185202 RepID=A0ACB9K132_9ASTR|nr:hypothetical protein L1987_07632 [Smallanthus sonchifolius]